MPLSHKMHQKLINAAAQLQFQLNEYELSHGELNDITARLSLLYERNEQLFTELKSCMEEYRREAGLFRKEYRRRQKELERQIQKKENAKEKEGESNPSSSSREHKHTREKSAPNQPGISPDKTNLPAVIMNKMWTLYIDYMQEPLNH